LSRAFIYVQKENGKLGRSFEFKHQGEGGNRRRSEGDQRKRKKLYASDFNPPGKSDARTQISSRINTTKGRKQSIIRGKGGGEETSKLGEKSFAE